MLSACRRRTPSTTRLKSNLSYEVTHYKGRATKNSTTIVRLTLARLSGLDAVDAGPLTLTVSQENFKGYASLQSH